MREARCRGEVWTVGEGTRVRKGGGVSDRDAEDPVRGGGWPDVCLSKASRED